MKYSNKGKFMQIAIKAHEDGSICKVLAVQMWGSEFKSSEPMQKIGMVNRHLQFQCSHYEIEAHGPARMMYVISRQQEMPNTVKLDP